MEKVVPFYNKGIEEHWPKMAPSHLNKEISARKLSCLWMNYLFCHRNIHGEHGEDRIR